jgi:hypothetical protein
MEELFNFFAGLFESIFSENPPELSIEADTQILGFVDADGDNIANGLLIAIEENGDGITDRTAVAYALDVDGDGQIDNIRVDYRDANQALNETAENVQHISMDEINNSKNA